MRTYYLNSYGFVLYHHSYLVCPALVSMALVVLRVAVLLVHHSMQSSYDDSSIVPPDDVEDHAVP